tara:strand:+ start:766 stop:1446 length:681 start_codon:yes stop_codon:yes gene_type:complete
MIWDDTGFLLSKNRYNENSLIVEVFTEEHGKCSGIIFGGTSRKNKNYLQIGNKIHINFVSKSENKIGYLKAEIVEAFSPFFFDNPQKLSCITSAMHLIKILTAEFQKNYFIYDLIQNFYKLLKKDNWVKNYIFWELQLLKVLGFDLEFVNLVDKKIINNKMQYVAKSSVEKKVVPSFLIEKSENEEDLSTLLSGLRLVGDYLDKTILKPNNLSQPLSRLHFINTLK